MIRFARPYAARSLAEEEAFGPADSFVGLTRLGGFDRHPKGVPLMSWQANGGEQALHLLPYPKAGVAKDPPVTNLPAKPRSGSAIKSEEDELAHDALARMHHVVARVNELSEALDDPENLWSLLRAAWDRAASQDDPRMAEIVRQAKALHPVLVALEKRLRRVLRRDREKVALDRVQEMDRVSMLWLARQPGRSVVERAGADQRVLAITRNEDFDTLENRVLRSYAELAEAVAREWMRENAAMSGAARYRMVQGYHRHCRMLGRELDAAGIGRADPNAQQNYVLQNDAGYRSVWTAWQRLLRRETIEDDLWAWQGETWTDFCVLALTLGLHALPDAKLVSQSPIVTFAEMMAGRGFRQENPLATFWLKDRNAVVEVQARPRGVSSQQAAARAVVWLRVTDIESRNTRRIAVWTPHMFEELQAKDEAEAALEHLKRAQQVRADVALRNGLILFPTHGRFETSIAQAAGCTVQAIGLAPLGAGLAGGLAAVDSFMRDVLAGEAV